MNGREWFRQAKFWMMVHLGLYALLGGEWKGERTPFRRDVIGELCLIGFDTPLTISPEQGAELYQLVKKYQPNCLINSRIGNGLGQARVQTLRGGSLIRRERMRGRGSIFALDVAGGF